jgi:hypothetical protein
MKKNSIATRIEPEGEDPFAEEDEEMWQSAKDGITVTTREPKLRELPEFADAG